MALVSFSVRVRLARKCSADNATRSFQRLYLWSRMISSRFGVKQGGCARNSSIRATVADPASLSLEHACVYRVTPSHGSSPTHENASRLFYSRASPLHSVSPPSSQPLSRPALPFHPSYKVSSRFSLKDSSHSKYLLIATFRSTVLVFPMRGGIRSSLLSWFFVAAEQTFALR